MEVLNEIFSVIQDCTYPLILNILIEHVILEKMFDAQTQIFDIKIDFFWSCQTFNN